MKKIILYVMMSLILALFVSANTVFENWGFSGYYYGGLYTIPKGLWSSGQYLGTTPTSMVNNSFKSDYFPIITNLNKGVSLTKSNEIYMFDGNIISIYDNSFSEIGSYIMTTKTGNAVIVDRGDSYNTFEIAYLSKSGANSTVRLLNRTGGGFVQSAIFDIADMNYSTPSVKAGLQKYLYIKEFNFNITRLDLETGAETYYAKPSTFLNLTRCADINTPYFQNEMDVYDLNSDGFDDIVYIGKDSVGGLLTFYIGIFNTNAGSWVTIKNTGESVTNGCGVSIAQIGTSSTPHKIIAHTENGDVFVYDQAGNEKFSSVDNGISADGRVNPVVADINLDGSNELIVGSGTLARYNLVVYNPDFSLLTTILNVNTSYGSRAGFTYYGLGRYLENSTWLDLVTYEGLKQINWSHKNVIKKYNLLGNTQNTFAALPVAIYSQNVKDILLLSVDSTTPNIAHFSSLAGAVCGNGLCESTETALSCPDDCAPTEPNAAVLTSVDINPCYTVTWKENTTVEIKAVSQNTDLSPVNIYAEFAPESILGGCDQYANQTGVASGSIVTFNFIANCTGAASIKISTNTNDVSDLNTLIFPFTVSSVGAEYGDSSCGTTQPLSQVLPPVNTTTDLEENFLTQGMRDFSAYTKLGMNILTFFVLIFVTGGIFFAGIKAGYSAQMVSGIVLLIDAFIVLIAVNLGWINVGIVITLAIVGLIAIGLWVAKLLHPAN